MKKKTISRTSAVNKIKNSDKQNFIIGWKKNDGNARTISGTVESEDCITNLGYITVQTGEDGYKNVNPKTMTELSIGDETFVIK